MSIAAVPRYLGKEFPEASPGLRFGPLLPIWTTRQDQEKDVAKRAEPRSPEAQEVKILLDREGMDATIAQLRNRSSRPLPGLWDKNDFAAKTAWKNICSLTDADQKRMKALLDRQYAVQATLPIEQSLCMEAVATAPFTTGLGNEHPLENGFAFLNPYGLPYLAGSGVKGVLRTAARELAEGEWGDTRCWSVVYPPSNRKGFPRQALSVIDLLFGLESEDGGDEHLRGALQFWDVIPQVAGDRLTVEIMTPHQSHYYQQKGNGTHGGVISPHESGAPVPISFLTIPPRSGFAFFVGCDIQHLERTAPVLAKDGAWKHLVQDVLELAFGWLGFGAKTATGYGAMAIDQKAVQARAQKEAAAREAAVRAQMSQAQRDIADYEHYMADRHKALIGKPTRIGAEYQKTAELARRAIESENWTADEKRKAAEAIMEWLPKVVQVDMKDQRKKLKLSQISGE